MGTVKKIHRRRFVRRNFHPPDVCLRPGLLAPDAPVYPDVKDICVYDTHKSTVGLLILLLTRPVCRRLKFGVFFRRVYAYLFRIVCAARQWAEVTVMKGTGMSLN